MALRPEALETVLDTLRPFARGKLVVATDEAEVPRIEAIYQQAVANSGRAIRLASAV